MTAAWKAAVTSEESRTSAQTLAEHGGLYGNNHRDFPLKPPRKGMAQEKKQLKPKTPLVWSHREPWEGQLLLCVPRRSLLTRLVATIGL